MTDYLYQAGSGLEIPGIEAKFEYGDDATFQNGKIPGALLVNDRSVPDQVHVTQLDGLHDDPDVSDSRVERAGAFGERSGILMPRGRTVGITGYVKAGNVGRMRDLWRRTRAQFGRFKRDLLVHPPGETALYVNEVWMDPARWTGSLPGATVAAMSTFTDGGLDGLSQSVSSAPAGSNNLRVAVSDSIPWSGEDVWMTALVKVQSIGAGGAVASASLGASFTGSTALWNPTGTGTVATPGTSSYQLLYARMTAADMKVTAGATHIVPRISFATSSGSTYTVRVARVAVVLLAPGTPSPSGYFGPSTPGFESEGVPGASRVYGPCYAVNQVPDVDSIGAGWQNDSTSGATVDYSGVFKGWPEGKQSSVWVLRNLSTFARTLAIKTSGSPPFVVHGNRKYRAGVRLRVDQAFVGLHFVIVWVDQAGAQISTSLIGTTDPVASGALPVEVELSGTATAPTLANKAYLRVLSSIPSVANNDLVSILTADPSFFDVSEYDPGDVEMHGRQAPELGIAQLYPVLVGGVFSTVPIGARRRIPRPFLLRGVRALWDGKAPETQRGLSARRDFTMSLRAEDPRIYVREERHAHLQASGDPKMIQSPTNSFQSQLSAALPVIASDGFNTGSAGTALNGRIAVSGGTWSTAGATGDWVLADYYSKAVQRTSSSDSAPRFGLLGPTTLTGCEAGVGVSQSVSSATNGIVDSGVSLRRVDGNNYLGVVLRATVSGGVVTRELVIYQTIAGTPTVLNSVPVPVVASSRFRPVKAIVYPSGRVSAVHIVEGAVIASVQAQSSALATGGTLQQGQCGIIDRNTAATGNTRVYDDFSVATVTADVGAAIPGFTAEGSSLDPKIGWIPSFPTGGGYPRDGIALGPLANANGFLAQSSTARMYRSSEGYTYGTPQVTVSGNAVGGADFFEFDPFEDSYIGGAWQVNRIGALIKRVSSNTWIELRYNTAHAAQMELAHPGTNPPSSLELWCSHNTSGSLTGGTRLDAWDVPVDVLLDGSIKFVRGYMDTDNVIYMELWSSSEPNAADIGLVSRRSYTLPASLEPIVGAGVDGHAGLSVHLARWDNGSSAGLELSSQTLDGFAYPYVSSFDAIDYMASTMWIACPVIGDADEVPWRLELRGGLEAPNITILSHGEDPRVSTLKLSGVCTDEDPVIVDFDAGTIRSSSGTNYFSRRQPGSRFENLTAGQNYILIEALGWDSGADVHAIATWRDALL